MGTGERMKKVKTGVDGLDKMLEGGLVTGRPYLVSGGPGAGKTILGMQFLFAGVAENEKSLYVSMEEKKENLSQNMILFGWDVSKLRVMEATPEIGNPLWEIKGGEAPFFDMTLSMQNLLKAIESEIEGGVSRIVVDSLTSLKVLYTSSFEARREMLALMHFLTDKRSTTLLLSETFMGGSEMECFLSDGVINLRILEDRGIKKRACEIQKMRGSSFDEQIRPMKITGHGIVVYPEENVFK